METSPRNLANVREVLTVRHAAAGSGRRHRTRRGDPGRSDMLTNWNPLQFTDRPPIDGPDAGISGHPSEYHGHAQGYRMDDPVYIAQIRQVARLLGCNLKSTLQPSNLF